ncbi:MAG TPA: response regulator [Patescibacteria group bacterium]
MKNLPRFILLDDDLLALTLARKIIRNYSRRAEIITFSAAKEAIAYIEANDIMGKHADTVFLTDLHMPEIEGFALLNQMENTFKALRKRLHIFVLSAGASPDEIRKVLSYGCVTGFYSKPLSIDYIKEIIDCLQYPL